MAFDLVSVPGHVCVQRINKLQEHHDHNFMVLFAGSTWI